jgi:hypothetical protein
MKLLLLLLLLLLCALYHFSFAQQTDTIHSPIPTKEQLLKKGKTQKTLGWILTGTGMPWVIGSMYSLVAFGKNDIEKGTVTAVLVASSLYTFMGTRLIKAGNKNKQQALSLGLKTNSVPLPSLGTLNYRWQPALSLRLLLL